MVHIVIVVAVIGEVMSKCDNPTRPGKSIVNKSTEVRVYIPYLSHACLSMRPLYAVKLLINLELIEWGSGVDARDVPSFSIPCTIQRTAFLSKIIGNAHQWGPFVDIELA